MKIRFTPHAKEKLTRLREKDVTEEKVKEVLANPERTEPGYFGRQIAQGSLTEDLVLRVVYERQQDRLLVITIYPGKRRRYE